MGEEVEEKEMDVDPVTISSESNQTTAGADSQSDGQYNPLKSLENENPSASTDVEANNMIPTDQTSPAEDPCVSDCNLDLKSTKPPVPVNNEINLIEEGPLLVEHDVFCDFEMESLKHEDKASTVLDLEDKVVYFANYDAKITPSPVLQYVLDVDQPYDTIIACGDGKIGAHRLVLATASPFIGDMFASSNHRLGEIAVLILPDIRFPIMKILLNFCYTGRMVFSKEDEKDILDAMRALFIGQLGDLTLNEVITRELPPDQEDDAHFDDSFDVLEDEANQHDLEARPSNSSALTSNQHHLGARPSSSSSLTSNRRRKQVCPISSTEDSSSDDSSSDSEKDDKNDDPDFVERAPSRSSYNKNDADVVERAHSRLSLYEPSPQEERFTVPKEFLVDIDDESSPYEYLIKPSSVNQHKKLHCAYCVGAFKSLETMSTHLDNNHGIIMECKKPSKEEARKLMHCNRCKQFHKRVVDISTCAKGRHLSCCYICFEIVKTANVKDHIKSNHTVREKGSQCVVNCDLCGAGIILEEPFDNKPLAAHFYSQHAPDFESYDFEEKSSRKARDGNKRQKDVLPQNSNTRDRSEASTGSSDTDSSLFISLPPRPKKSKNVPLPAPFAPPPVVKPSTKVGKTKKKDNTATPMKSRSTAQKTKQVPTVIEMLQRASLKRKRAMEENTNTEENESETGREDDGKENSTTPAKRGRNKRPRLEKSNETPVKTYDRPQVARRTGMPVGRLIEVTDDLRPVNRPEYAGTDPGRGGTTVVTVVELDLDNIPDCFVQLKYNKSFINDFLQNGQDSEVGTPVVDKNGSNENEETGADAATDTNENTVATSASAIATDEINVEASASATIIETEQPEQQTNNEAGYEHEPAIGTVAPVDCFNNSENKTTETENEPAIGTVTPEDGLSNSETETTETETEPDSNKEENEDQGETSIKGDVSNTSLEQTDVEDGLQTSIEGDVSNTSLEQTDVEDGLQDTVSDTDLISNELDNDSVQEPNILHIDNNDSSNQKLEETEDVSGKACDSVPSPPS